QREALARDWQAGQDQLLTYLRFLRMELRELRKRNRAARALRVAGMTIIHNPGVLLLILSLIALDIAFYGVIRPVILRVLIPQTLAVIAFIAAKAWWSWWPLQPVRLPRPKFAPAAKPRSKARQLVRSQPVPPGIKAPSP